MKAGEVRNMSEYTNGGTGLKLSMEQLTVNRLKVQFVQYGQTFSSKCLKKKL